MSCCHILDLICLRLFEATRSWCRQTDLAIWRCAICCSWPRVTSACRRRLAAMRAASSASRLAFCSARALSIMLSLSAVSSCSLANKASKCFLHRQQAALLSSNWASCQMLPAWVTSCVYCHHCMKLPSASCIRNKLRCLPSNGLAAQSCQVLPAWAIIDCTCWHWQG